MSTELDNELGRIAYEAWLEERRRAQSFFPCISWTETDKRVRRAWVMAAQAVASSALRGVNTKADEG